MSFVRTELVLILFEFMIESNYNIRMITSSSVIYIMIKLCITIYLDLIYLCLFIVFSFVLKPACHQSINPKFQSERLKTSNSVEPSQLHHFETLFWKLHSSVKGHQRDTFALVSRTLNCCKLCKKIDTYLASFLF